MTWTNTELNIMNKLETALVHWRTFLHVVLASTKKYHLRHIYLVTDYQADDPQLLDRDINFLF